MQIKMAVLVFSGDGKNHYLKLKRQRVNSSCSGVDVCTYSAGVKRTSRRGVYSRIFYPAKTAEPIEVSK